MVRIARRETIEHRTGYQESRRDEDVVVGGVNHDALSGENKRIAEDHKPLASCRCIAGKCAMWRWVPTTESVPTVTLGASGQAARTFGVQTVRTHGYCGIAGRPEVN